MTLLLGTDAGAVGATALVVVHGAGRACLPEAVVWHWHDDAGLFAADAAVRVALAGSTPASWYGEQPFGLARAPKAGVRQGQAIGWWQHVARTLGVELQLVPPATWRRAWGVPHGPGSTSAAARHSRALVHALWPDLDTGPADHGCDAVLQATHADDDVREWAAHRLRELAVAGDDQARRLLVALGSGGERVRRRGGGRRPATTTGDARQVAAAGGRRGGWTEADVAAHRARLGR